MGFLLDLDSAFLDKVDKVDAVKEKIFRIWLKILEEKRQFLFELWRKKHGGKKQRKKRRVLYMEIMKDYYKSSSNIDSYETETKRDIVASKDTDSHDTNIVKRDVAYVTAIDSPNESKPVHRKAELQTGIPNLLSPLVSDSPEMKILIESVKELPAKDTAPEELLQTDPRNAKIRNIDLSKLFEIPYRPLV